MCIRNLTSWILAVGMIVGCCGDRVDGQTDAKRPPLLVALTFDDGVKDHITIVAPALARYGYKGSFNLITDSIGRDERHLTWDEVRQLAREGHELVSHTCSHPNMRQLVHADRPEFDRQIRESAAKIEAETGIKVRNVCLPGNNGDAAVLAAIAELGYGLQERNRPNLGGDFGLREVDAYLNDRIAEGTPRCALMMHAIQGGGYRPFPNGAADFEAILKRLQEREACGELKVVPYAEAYAE